MGCPSSSWATLSKVRIDLPIVERTPFLLGSGLRPIAYCSREYFTQDTAPKCDGANRNTYKICCKLENCFFLRRCSR
jgi:hypothetical protein